MARKRVIETPRLQSWEDVNDALRQLAEAQIALSDIESDMQKQIIGAQKAAEEQSRPIKDAQSQLKRDIEVFTTAHRDEMGEAKSMSLTFGEVGFRASVSISVPKEKAALAEVIRRLKSRNMMDCIIVKETVSRDALKTYGEDTVNAAGAAWKQKDEFHCDVNIAKLEQIKAGG